MDKQAHKFFQQGLAQFSKKLWVLAAQNFEKARAYDPKSPEILEALASTICLTGDIKTAQKYFLEAIDLSKPEPSLSLLSNYAHLLQRAGALEVAIKQYKDILVRAPNYALAWSNLGECYRNQMKIMQAANCYEKVWALEPNNYEALNSLSYCYHTLCLWDKADAVDTQLFQVTSKEIKAGRAAVIGSFPALFLKTNPASLKMIAESHSRTLVEQQRQQKIFLPARKKDKKRKRIRVGYFSVAFSRHATSLLVQDMFKHHDREKFEVFLYAVNAKGECPHYSKIKQSAEHVFELQSMADLECAHFIQSHELDILIDMDGVIKDNRQGVLCLKPAPIQIAWLGYPGTSGAPWIDYILADDVVIPKDHEVFYSEKILRMPNSYQFNSFASCPIESSKREDWGIPEGVFVFASFNVSRKFDRATFEAWCSILKRVDGSLLWVLVDDDVCLKVLSDTMVAAGLDSSRLIRAKRIDNMAHLSRIGCADLFLDSFICNAHTTCTEALAAGLPVLTCTGNTFAGRVASSLLMAANMEECVTTTPQEYIERAVSLATEPKRLKFLKEHLQNNKNILPLFDQKKWLEDLENILVEVVSKDNAKP